MEKLLIAGVNTRALVQSAYELGYETYSASYFCTTDFNSYHHKKCILKQKAHYSCGYFQESFHPDKLKELCSEWIDEVDHIITYTGISPENFPSSKIIGNKNINEIENKYKLYRNLRKKFNLPLTFLLSDLEEAHEINSQYPEKEFLIKPVQGSGGYDVFKFKNLLDETIEFHENQFLMQEFITGENVSTSVLSTGKEARSILSSKQILGKECPGLKNGFVYCGNLTPYPGDDHKLKSVSEELIIELGLIGSNGIDMIVSDDDLYVIEVNPRIQGTFECAEISLGINMIEAHIKASHGELIKPPKTMQYAVKKIFYAPKRCIMPKINLSNVYDLPLENSIIEKGEPMVTVLGSGKSPNDAFNSADESIKNIKKRLIPMKS